MNRRRAIAALIGAPIAAQAAPVLNLHPFTLRAISAHRITKGTIFARVGMAQLDYARSIDLKALADQIAAQLQAEVRL